MSNEEKLNAVLNYSATMIGVPYRWCREGEIIGVNDKFYASNTKEVFTREQIDKDDKCIVCTGLVNLMRIYMGLTIPGVVSGPWWWQKWPGTTGTWFEYLNEDGRLENIDSTKKYPKGTMLLKNFESVDGEQGHVAVVHDDDMNVIHAFATLDFEESKTKETKNHGETNIQPFQQIQDWSPEGYFTHVCLPENWLFTD